MLPRNPLRFVAGPVALSTRKSRISWNLKMASSNDFIKHGMPLTGLIEKNCTTWLRKPLLEAETNHTFQEARLHQKNLRSQWKIINCPLPFKSKERQIYLKDLKSIANEFNQFFGTVNRNAEASSNLVKKNNIEIPEISIDLPTIN